MLPYLNYKSYLSYTTIQSVVAWEALGLINYTNESNEFTYSKEADGADIVDTANTAAAWTAAGTNTVVQDGDAVKVTYVDNADGATLDLTAAGGLSENLVAGRIYTITFDAKATIVSNVSIVLNTAIIAVTGTYASYSKTFIATGTDLVKGAYLGAGEDFSIKNIVVKDTTGEQIVTNQGSGLTTYDGKLYSGESIEYGSAQKIIIPLSYTLGAELVTNGTFITDTDWTKDTGWTISGGTANASGVSIAMTQDVGIVPSSSYYVSYDILNYVSGYSKVEIVGGASDIKSADGSYTGFLSAYSGASGVVSVSAAYLASDFSFDNFSVKKVNHEAGCIALYNTSNGEWDYITTFYGDYYEITAGTYGHIVVLATEPSAADKTYLEANIHAFSDLYFDRATELTSIVKADIQHLYIPNVLQTSTLQDIVGIADITIPNYAATMYTNADQNPKGQQTTNITFDGTGLATGVTYDTMDWGGNHYLDTQWNPSLLGNFWIEEIIGTTVYQHKFDGTNITTYTNNVAGTPALHTPENASYLLGKGVYPKVSADPYTTYTSKYFSVVTSEYATYNQAERYAVLALL